MSTINFLQYFSSLSSNPWLATPLAQLLPSASWLMPPAVALLVALASGWQERGRFGEWARSPSGALILSFVAAAACLVVVSTRPFSPILRTEAYVSYLMPFMALAVEALAAPLLERLSVRQWQVLVGVVIVCLPGSIVIEGWRSGTLASWVTDASGWVVVVGLAAAFGLVAARRGDFASLVGAVLAFALVNPFGPGPKTALLIPDAAVRRETFLKVVTDVRAIDSAWPGSQAWLWFNDQEDEAYGLTACALAACDRNLISRAFPALRQAALDTSSAPLLAPGRPVVVHSTAADAIDLIAAATGGLVAAPQQQFSRVNSAGTRPFTLHFLQEPEQGWQVSLPPSAWMRFQPNVATVQADGAFRSDHGTDQPGFMAFGPYVSLPAGQCEVTFWMSGYPAAVTGDVAQLDISVAVSPKDFVGGRRALQADDFPGDGAAQPFSLTFVNSNAGNVLEFRVQTLAKMPLTLSRIQLRWLDAGPVGWLAPR